MFGELTLGVRNSRRPPYAVESDLYGNRQGDNFLSQYGARGFGWCEKDDRDNSLSQNRDELSGYDHTDELWDWSYDSDAIKWDRDDDEPQPLAAGEVLYTTSILRRRISLTQLIYTCILTHGSEENL